MAQTIGDIISRNYGAGRAIGDDFSQSRFARGAAKIREEYETRAKEEGQSLDAYLPEMEDRLRSLYTDSGSARRGVLGRSGQSLDNEYAADLRTAAARMGERRAGALAIGGDQAGAREQRARTQYAIGDFDAGQSQQVAGDTILATQDAMRPDGSYDMAKGAQNLAGVGARYGNADAANAQQAGASTFRLQAARAKADSIFNMAQNPSAFSEDQFAGAWEGFKENVPELKGVDLRKGPNDILYVYTNGQPTGSFDPKNQADVSELATLMGQFTKDPGASLNGYLQTRLQNIADAKTRDSDTAKRFSEARIAVVKDLQSAGLPPALAGSFVEAQSKLNSGGGGWQLQDIGDAPGSFLMQKDGQSYIVKTNVAADPKTGAPAADVQITDLDGNPMPGSALNRADRTSLSASLGSLAADIASSNYRLQTGILKDKLSVLNQLESQERGLQPAPAGARSGGGGSRADRNFNPGNIEDGNFAKNQPGYVGGDGRFAKFETMEAGEAAQTALLQSYGRRGFDTVQKVIDRWSPQSDPTNPSGSTRNYMDYVASRMGVDPGEQLNLASPEVAARLRTAMYEFESGNTQRGALGSVGQRTAVSKPTPRNPEQVAAAPAAPRAGAKRGPAITPRYLSGAAGELNSQADTLRQKEAALAQFDRDMGTQLRQVPGPTNASVARQVPVNLTPEQARVREQLVADLATTQASVQDATREIKANTGALRRSTEQAKNDKGAAELYAKYGGAADFFSRAGGSR